MAIATIKTSTVATLELLTEAHLPELCAHFRRHGAESGRDGDAIFRPRSTAEEFDDDSQVTERHRSAWSRPPQEPQWLRTWGVVEAGTILGHLDLNGGRLPAVLHRATLGMGIERQARRLGHGQAMLEAAILWARVHRLAWLDLRVFAHNYVARSLYTANGFIVVGSSRDQFRVDGVSIDDVAMTLAL